MTKRILLVSVGLLFYFILASQNKPEYFKTIPQIDASTPAWAKLMYEEDPDVRQVNLEYTNYYRVNPYQKDIHARNYKFWFRKVSELIDDNGKIRPPSLKEENQKWQFLKNKKAKQRINSLQGKTSGTWVNLGPSETYTADGTQTAVSWQANIYSLDQSKSNSDILFAGSESGGVFKTTDKGLNWSLVSANEVFAGGILATRIHPTDPNTVYIGANNRVYKTIDGGTSWNEMFNLGTTPQRLFLHQTNHDTVFCASNDGFHRSYDGGVTWTRIFTEKCYDIESHPTDHDTLYLTKNDPIEVRSELFRTVDGGATWVQMTSGWYAPTVIGEARDAGSRIAVTPINPDYVYVALIGEAKANDKGWIGIYKSTNAGNSWNNPNLPDGGPYVQTTHPNLATQNWTGTSFTQGFYNFGFAASHLTSEKLWIGNLSWWETSDGGLTFDPLGGYASGSRHSWTHPDVQDVLVSGGDVWYATDGGIDYSNDEMQTKESRKKGITSVDYWGFGSGWNEDVLVGGRYHNGNSGYIPAYGAGNHLRLGGAESPTGHVDPLKERTGYFNDISTAKIPNALNQSVIYSPKLGMYPTTHYWESYSSELEFDPRYAGHIYIGNTDGFWKSTDGGANFSRIYQFAANSRVEEIEICRSNPDTIYVAAKEPNGGYWDWSNIFRSSDGGNSFTQLPNPTTSNRRGIHLAHDPVNAANLWISIVGGANGSKVYKSSDSGATWVNKTTSTLDGESVKDIQYVGGTTASVYIVTNNSVYYFDENTSDWVAFDTDLPFQTRALQMRPFFRDGKMRLATGGRGIFETDLFENPAPVAQPMTYVDSVFCSRDTIELDCYSVLNHAGASWNWAITPTPLYISSTTTRNPKVVLGADGNYNVTLAVTDGNGVTNSKTINDMIVVQSTCEPDSLAGNALTTVADGDKFISQEADLQNITNFTVTAWIKPEGAQEIAAGIVSDGEWCFHCTDRHGFVYNYNGNRLWYAWPGNESNWAGNSGLEPIEGEWNYVALVIYPDSAVIYLNEERYVHVKALSPGNIYNLNVGYGHYSRSFHGDLDEVTVWDRSLSQSEIREMRHLTKSGTTLSDPNLISYYQFTQLVNGTRIMDSRGTNHGTLTGSAGLSVSSAPVGPGTMQRITVGAGNLEPDFTNAGAKLYLNDCNTPSGEMVVSRLSVAPHTLPNTNNNGDNHWLINYYGENSDEFAYLDSLELIFDDPGFVSGLGSVSDAKLHFRGANNDDESWTTSASARNNNSGTLAFDRAISIDSSLQILLTDGAAAFAENTPDDFCEVDPVPDTALKCSGSPDYAQTPDFSFLTDTITISAWIKPSGIQPQYAGIVISDGDTGGMNFRESNNTLGYHWNGGWSWDSGLEIPVDEWSHVAMVVLPNSVTLYLNGVGVTDSRSTGNLNFTSAKIGSYKGWGSRNFSGEIDEVVIWKRPLTQEEIRESMHLTKETSVANDPLLLAYYQFNENNTVIYDKSPNKNHAAFNGNAGLITSTAPFGSGTSEKMTVNSGGPKIFAGTGVTLGFPITGTYPDGEILTYRINTTPDTLPGNKIIPNHYWIIQNFGTNSTFSTLDSIGFSNISGIQAVHQSNNSLLKLHSRNEQGHLSNWMNRDEADFVSNSGNGKISFTTGNGIEQARQFAISNGLGVLLSAKAILSGAYISGMMHDSLRQKGLIPTTEPFTALGFNHVNGGGSETCPAYVMNVEGNNAIVDWVFLELRDGNDSTIVLYTRSALLQRDGDIVDTDGLSPVEFSMPLEGDYFVGLRHRNHLGIVSGSSINVFAPNMTVDFTNISTVGINGQKDLGAGISGMWLGDVNQSKTIDAADRHEVWNNKPANGYRSDDVDLNGVTDGTDTNKVWDNRNVFRDE